MKDKRHPTKEIICILREADIGKSIKAASFNRWKKKYAGMELKGARRYREMGEENGELKKIQRR